MKNRVVYPGTFDPITNGHLDIIKRAGRMFEHVTVAVAEADMKNPLFSLEERVNMVKCAVAGMKNVKVGSYKGLLVKYLKKVNRRIVIRGLRAIADFEYEFQLNLMNKKLGSNIEMVYLMPDEQYIFISSSAVKEVAYHGGNSAKFLPAYVEKKLKAKIKTLKNKA